MISKLAEPSVCGFVSGFGGSRRETSISQGLDLHWLVFCNISVSCKKSRIQEGLCSLT